MKIRSFGAELFRADGHTDMTMLIVAFGGGGGWGANAPGMCYYWKVLSLKASVGYYCVGV